MAIKKLTKEQIINLFVSNFPEWEKYRKNVIRNKNPVDLSNMICGIDLNNYMDSNIDFTNSIFRISDLSNVSLTGCCFKECFFQTAVLESSIFISCNFIRCAFESCSFKRTDFIKCKMTDCSFVSTQIHQGTFYEDDLSNTQMLKSNLKYCILKSCNLKNVMFPSSTCSQNNLFNECKNLPGLIKFDMEKYKMKDLVINKYKQIEPEINKEDEYETPVISKWRKNSDFET